MGQDSRRIIPRISLEEMPTALAEMLRPKVTRLGYLGEFFQCTAAQPEALMSFMRFTDDLKDALPDNFTEIVALTVSKFMSTPYERIQHEGLCLKLGFSTDWIRDVLSLFPSAAASLKPDERSIQQLVLAMLNTRGHDAAREMDAAVECAGSRQAIAVLLLTGRYMTHTLVVNTLKLAPPLQSPLGQQ